MKINTSNNKMPKLKKLSNTQELMNQKQKGKSYINKIKNLIMSQKNYMNNYQINNNIKDKLTNLRVIQRNKLMLINNYPSPTKSIFSILMNWRKS